MAQAAHGGSSSVVVELLELFSRISGDLEAMRAKIAQLQSDLESERKKSERLEKEKLELEGECRQYKKTILAMIPPSEPFTEEEINDLMINGVTFDKVLADLEELERA